MTNETFSTIKLLFVEDDEDDFILTSELLKQSELLDFAIDWVSSAGQAREALARNDHDICLMDHRLGPELGINLVRDAVMLGFSSPIIMLTGQRNTGVEIEAAEAGAVDFLVKDELSMEQLQRAIRYALARSEIQAERFERLRAESANRSKSEFLATLSHEIRTPLTAILGYTELLMDQYTGTDEDLTAHLGIIDRNGKHLLSLLNNTLDLSKIEAGKFEIEIREVELGNFLADIISLIKLSAEEKGLQFNVNCLSDLPAMVHTDDMRLRQILLNLLGNGIKFTDKGSIDLSIELRGQPGGGHVLVFSVRDTGKGISQEHLEDIFDPFSQLPTDQRLQQGTGLGLTISLRLAERLGGTIKVESTPGQGSLFILTIDPGEFDPATVGPVDLSTAVSASAIERIEGVEGKVLIVDDVEDVRTLIGNILTKGGLDIAFATDGREAVELLRQEGPEHYALVLMDLNMPVMNGYEAMAEMNKAGMKVPTVALTAASLQGEKEKCMEAGFSGYISKPITASSLIAVISSTLASAGEAPARAASKDKDGEAAAGASRGRNILVVEDNQDANDALCMLLRHLNNEVRPALNAEEALDQCSLAPPDLAMVDINLPDSDGFSLARRIHEQWPDTRLVLVSGHSVEAGDLPSYISDCIIKPVSLPALQQALSR